MDRREYVSGRRMCDIRSLMFLSGQGRAESLSLCLETAILIHPSASTLLIQSIHLAYYCVSFRTHRVFNVAETGINCLHCYKFFISVSQMKNVKPREVGQPFQGHTARKEQSWIWTQLVCSIASLHEISRAQEVIDHHLAEWQKRDIFLVYHLHQIHLPNTFI